MQVHAAGKRRSSYHAVVLGLALLGAGVGGQAIAGCGSVPPGLPAPAGTPSSEEQLLKAIYHPQSQAFMRVFDDQERNAEGAIVGTWRFTFVSDGGGYPGQHLPPYGATVDFGTQQWHSDGTEFLISGARPPSTGDVCMGSWEQTGRSTYKLKHIALAWISTDSNGGPSPAQFLGPSIIREVVTLNRRSNAFEGTFTIDQYQADEVTLVVHLSGKVTGTRFSVD